jgi:4-hydroxybenzoate polyprenyltransferase
VETNGSSWTAVARPFLILGRVSNLPTVWSNCLAGWLLSGGGGTGRLLALWLGATLLYLGGVYLNDAFDVEFDTLRRKERPIPSGQVSQRLVLQLGTLWLVLGSVLLTQLGKTTGVLAALLALNILLYDLVHKVVTFSPVLMAGCRFLLYLVAASAAEDGVTGLVVWSGLALGSYIAGLSYLAREETRPAALRYWPVALFFPPVGLATLINWPAYPARSFLLSAILAAWVLYSVWTAFGSRAPNVPRMISGLLAGIVLVDYLAVVDWADAFAVSLTFFLLFVAARLLQRFVPAT